MIVGGLLAVAPVFGPLGNTLRYLADFIAERPQPMRAPDMSFFVELLALIICPVGLLLFTISPGFTTCLTWTRLNGFTSRLLPKLL
jgi:hypothetical protein